LAERGLSDAELLGGTAEMEFFRDNQKRVELPKINLWKPRLKAKRYNIGHIDHHLGCSDDGGKRQIIQRYIWVVGKLRLLAR
jgi:hypothetical protein